MFVSRPGQYPRSIWIVAVIFLLGLDQASKMYFSHLLPLGEAMEVSAWFNLVHVRNPGAAFSFLANASGWQRYFLIGVSLLVILPVGYLCLTNRIHSFERWAGVAVVAGGTGNLIDRIHTGAVVDFLDFHWNGWHWPAFNFADIFVVCAMALWMAWSFNGSGHSASTDLCRKGTP
jgi:signal peptidase II